MSTSDAATTARSKWRVNVQRSRMCWFPETVAAHRERLQRAGLFALSCLATLLQLRVDNCHPLTMFDFDALADCLGALDLGHWNDELGPVLRQRLTGRSQWRLGALEPGR